MIRGKGRPGDGRLIGGVLGGVGMAIVTIADRAPGDSSAVVIGIVLGVAISIAGALYWAMLRAVSLRVTYLWRVQAELSIAAVDRPSA